MKNKDAERVIKMLEEKNKRYNIQIIGDKENKDNGFYILMNTQSVVCDKNETYYGLTKETLKLLDKAKIKYRLIK